MYREISRKTEFSSEVSFERHHKKQGHSQPYISANWHETIIQLHLGRGIVEVIKQCRKGQKQGIISLKTACPKYLNASRFQRVYGDFQKLMQFTTFGFHKKSNF